MRRGKSTPSVQRNQGSAGGSSDGRQRGTRRMFPRLADLNWPPEFPPPDGEALAELEYHFRHELKEYLQAG